jgi:hypothetical protein
MNLVKQHATPEQLRELQGHRRRRSSSDEEDGR